MSVRLAGQLPRVALSEAGAAVGLMDADVYGPSLPLLTGVTGRPRTQDKRIFPHEGNGLKLMSIGFLVTDDSLLSCLGQAMHEIAVSEFQYAIPGTHGSRSQLIERVSVVETFEGDTVWEGEVLVSAVRFCPGPP